MPKRALSVARAVPLAVMLAFAADRGASAAEDCLASPNRQADPGTRWAQRFDRGNDRQCWYLKKDVAAAPAGTARVEPAASPNADDQSNIMSWLSSKFDADALRAPPERSRPPPRPLRMQRRSARRAVAKRSDAAKASPRQPPSSTASGQPPAAAPFDPDTREALFKEYLEWKKQQPAAK